MGIWDSILSGFSELFAHKLRSFLTMLGVIFGVAAVIAMVSIGAGARTEALAQLRLLGVDVIRITRKPLAGQALKKATERSPFGLEYGDALAIRKTVGYAPSVVAVRQVTAEMDASGPPVQPKVLGTTAGYLLASRTELSAGRFISDSDNDQSSRVCVLGSGIKRRLFGFDDAIGHTIRLSGLPFTVIGVTAEKELPAKMVVNIPDQNMDVYIPISVAISDFQLYSEQPMPTNEQAVIDLLRNMNARQAPDNSPISAVIVQAGSEVAAPPTAQVISDLLERRHRDVDDYAIDIPSELIRQSQATQRVFNIVMAAIAGISLLVGGIGIMNIMLATVTQRTREIGIRRCVGARRSDILRQFVVEALVITILGGVIGAFLGIGGATAISQFAGWKTVVSPQAVALSMSVACVVGLIFGLYPAVRAAHVDPMTALRYE